MNKQVVHKPGALLAPQLDYILVDGSGSMQDKWFENMIALEAFIESLKTANLNSHLILSVFDTLDISMIQRDCELRSHTPFSADPLVSHWSTTPLYDAINHMGRAIRDLDPERASIVIVTDGDENASTYTDATQARAILDWLKAKGFAVTFIGCDFNNSLQARRLGISDSNSIGVQKALLTDAAKNLAEKRKHHYHTGEDISFTQDEKTQFGGLLAAPPNGNGRSPTGR